MKVKVFAIIGTILTLVSVEAAYQYNVKGNQGWLTFDSETTVAFDLDRSGKDSNKENYIDRGQGVADYGWYNLDTDEAGSFNNGTSATFSENDRIGLWVKDNAGNVYLSSKPPQKSPDNVLWGKSRLIEENIAHLIVCALVFDLANDLKLLHNQPSCTMATPPTRSTLSSLPTTTA
jgi:hypothetical protein